MIYKAISVFDMFKIGIGPSSSHTLGPWRSALMFIDILKQKNIFSNINKIEVLLYGSLAKTGKGHGTDIAVVSGLSGEDPVTTDVETILAKAEKILVEKKVMLNNERLIETTIQFLYNETLPQHPNALQYIAYKDEQQLHAEIFYSIGGGFLEREGDERFHTSGADLPFPINDANDLLHWCMKTGLSICDVVAENEQAWRSDDATKNYLWQVWLTMRNCMYRGCHVQGTLPGGLQVRRRAYNLNKRLIQQQHYNDYNEWIELIKKGGNSFQYILDWVSCFALAVNEENASFGRVVTAPTNGAAGVIPAVLQYFIIFCDGDDKDKIIRFLLTAGETGSIFKKGATISAAMGGCQAEIGVSSAMAAAALTESLGGTQKQALMAAEIAMEHHLGLTCDPIGGLVQVPCIERNTMGAIKAITASQLALQSSPDFARVSLDNVIKTMWDTALDMNSKYKETADGGLALHIPLGLKEC